MKVKKKLRSQTLLPLVLCSDKYGKFQIKNYEVPENEISLRNENSFPVASIVNVSENDFNEQVECLPVLVYIAGYSVIKN